MGLCRACLFVYAAGIPEEAPPGPAPGVEAGEKTFADYALGRQLGRGGMGVVYEAVQISLRRPVALKMILDTEVTSKSAKRRFTLEAETAASLDHPNIVPIYEIGAHQGQPFLSMKLIVGDDLRKKILSGDLCLTPTGTGAGQVDWRERAVSVVRVMATIARAVHHAHSKDVLHRDLKPANILLDQDGQPHLTDFGLAKVLGPAAADPSSAVTGSGTTLGTPGYMSPEQASGDRLTPASDVYSLGTIFYEMLAGRLPFTASTLLELLRLVAEQEPTPPSSHNPRIDRDLDTICLKCLEKTAGARYPTAQALADDLELWLIGVPIRARPIGPLLRTTRWARRNPLGTSLIASLCICLAVSLGLLHLRRLRDKDAADQRDWVTDRIGQMIDNAWENEFEERFTITSRDLAALVNGPIPKANALTLTFALNIPDHPVSVATSYARFLGEMEKQMVRVLGRQVNFDLHLYKARSWEALSGARKGADLQTVTYLTYVRLREASPQVQPLVVERFRSQGAVYARANAGISNLNQVAGHSAAFAHTNSIVSFLGKVALAQAGVCAPGLSFYTNLNARRQYEPHAATAAAGADLISFGNEGFAHRDVLARVLTGEFEVGVAPWRRFRLRQNDGTGLVELCRYRITPDVYVSRAGLPAEVVHALRASLLAISDSKLLAGAKPGMRDGFEAVTDADFDSFRHLLANEFTFFETGR